VSANYDDEETIVVREETAWVHETMEPGLVDLELPGMPPRQSEEGSPYRTVVDVIDEALEVVGKRIDFLVETRSNVNAEIKVLRDELERLTRMKKIAEAK
jgi:hypothetical protein